MPNAELSNFSPKLMAGVLRWGLMNSSLSLVCSGCCTADGFLGSVLGSGGAPFSYKSLLNVTAFGVKLTQVQQP